MTTTVLKAMFLAFLLTVLLAGCAPSRERGYDNPGHEHAQQVGEMKLPNGQ